MDFLHVSTKSMYTIMTHSSQLGIFRSSGGFARRLPIYYYKKLGIGNKYSPLFHGTDG
jgi:hypothetical protein